MFSDRLTLKEHKGHQLSCRGAGCSVAGLLDGKVNPNGDSKTVISACEKNTKTMSFLAVVPDIWWQPHMKAESTLMETGDQLLEAFVKRMEPMCFAEGYWLGVLTKQLSQQLAPQRLLQLPRVDFGSRLKATCSPVPSAPAPVHSSPCSRLRSGRLQFQTEGFAFHVLIGYCGNHHNSLGAM
ncbi:hypothetical protein P7K49_014297 [Saguinus oedipus]|uniref:Uncharacterized protein n=1 Tax=Saguinus oedipus TaxID=9490 RepID=A0ABQ9VLG1_SAGOE|nr:hypothetical protein P7K49_014297 [Saguinus oedipus]